MDSDREQRIEAEIERLRIIEAGNRELLNYSVGGAMTLKPNEGFIKFHIGKFKTDEQIKVEATKNIDIELAKEVRLKAERADFDRSVREHNAAIEREQAQKQEPRDPFAGRKLDADIVERDLRARERESLERSRARDDFNKVR